MIKNIIMFLRAKQIFTAFLLFSLASIQVAGQPKPGKEKKDKPGKVTAAAKIDQSKNNPAGGRT